MRCFEANIIRARDRFGDRNRPLTTKCAMQKTAQQIKTGYAAEVATLSSDDQVWQAASRLLQNITQLERAGSSCDLESEALEVLSKPASAGRNAPAKT